MNNMNIDEQINALLEQKRQQETAELSGKLYELFSPLSKEEIMVKLGEFISSSGVIRMEIKQYFNL